MKKIIVIAAIIAAAAAAWSCKGVPGSPGPSGAEQYTAAFQSGVYPSVYFGASDALIYEGVPGGNYGADASTFVGNIAGASGRCRIIIKFDLTGGAIPSNAIVSGVELRIRTGPSATGGSTTLVVKELGTAWIEAETTWHSAALGVPWAADGGDFGASSIGLNEPVLAPSNFFTIKLDPAIVQGWIADPATNYGIILSSKNEVIVNATEVDYSDNTTVAYRPRLTITYKLP
jgi:hypothetical protein